MNSISSGDKNFYINKKIKDKFKNSNFYTVLGAASFLNLGATKISKFLIEELKNNLAFDNIEEIIFINHSNGCAFSYDLLSKVSDDMVNKFNFKFLNYSGYSSLEDVNISFYFPILGYILSLKIMLKLIKFVLTKLNIIGETDIVKIIENSSFSDIKKNNVEFYLTHGNRDHIVNIESLNKLEKNLLDKGFKNVAVRKVNKTHAFII